MSRRILFWSERFWPTIGGVGLNAARLLPALRARGYEFTVVTEKANSDRPEEDELEGIRVCRWPFWEAMQSRDIMKLLEMRKRVADLKQSFDPDLVHIGFLGSSVLFHDQTGSVHPSPVLVSLDSAFLGEGSGEDSLTRKILASADWITTVSGDRLAKLHNVLPEVEPKSSCVYVGTATPDTDPVPPARGPAHVLCVGRLDPVKGFDLAIEAFSIVAERHPDARMTIAGDGPERADLESRIERAGLSGAVDMMGWVDPGEIPGLMQRSSIVLMPSRDEGIPAVALEAGLSARPVAAAWVGGLAEIIDDGRTGLLFEAENPPAIAEAIGRLIQDPDQAAEFGQNARIHISERFSFETYVDAHDELYQRLTSAE